MFKLNPLEVITILTPVIIVLWRFFHVAFEEMRSKEMYEIEKEASRKTIRKMQKDFKKIEKELREYGTYDWNDDPDLIIESSKDHIRLNKTICLSCRKANDHVPPLKAEFYKKERTEQQEIHIFTLDKNVTCEHCGFMYSTVEGVIHKGTRKKDKPMGKKVLLKGYSCEYCNHHVNSDTPVHAEIIKDGEAWLDKKSFKCPECDAESHSVNNPLLWENPIKKPTVQEIMDQSKEKQERMDTFAKIMVFIGMWIGAALAIYGLSFVPWIPILISFWILTKNLTYALTRWYSLCGLFVTLLIFYQWHKQAIKDKVAYLSNIYGTRRRYRKMVSRKESVTEDELKSFVNEVNHAQEREEITEKNDSRLQKIDNAIEEYEEDYEPEPPF